MVQTSSLPPVVVKASHVGMDSLTLHLDPPAQLGTGTHIENFQLKYSAMDENGTFIIENTERNMFLSPTSLQVTVPYLLPGVIYSFQSKVKRQYNRVRSGEIGVTYSHLLVVDVVGGWVGGLDRPCEWYIY